MITLEKVEINKYKSIQQKQVVDIEKDVTTIVGMNESGKTNFLKVIGKTNYFNNDSDFNFDLTQDYPRNDLIDFEESGEEWEIIKCKYSISQELLKQIEDEIGKDVFKTKEFEYSCYYRDKSNTFNGISASIKKFLEQFTKDYSIGKDTLSKILNVTTLEEINAIEKTEEDEDLDVLKKRISEIIKNSYEGWSNKLEGYIASKWIKPNMPKFWYFDDYYHLGGKINIQQLRNESLEDEKLKTAKALFELARIKPEEIINTSDYERFVALLEASSNKITNEIFKYWSANNNLDIEFRIQDSNEKQQNGQPIVVKYLDIRVKSLRHKVTLPLDRRSKGFNFFFSFIIWFSKIQADKDSRFILLLDEPGLSLHASAQDDLLRFIEELSKKYQIIYTTHSPFMVRPDKLNRIRTCLETDKGTIISDSIQEKDPNTLFPLQAALGYDIAQNLFVSKNNLLVEGPADLIYLTVLSNILESEKRVHLKDDITIVPVGGLDKVSTFISLLRGQKLNIACLLDTFTNQKGKQKVDDLIHYKIIKEKNIRFFDEFSNNGSKVVDIEDLFEKEEYLKLFNAAFDKDYKEIKISDLDSKIDTILKQINAIIGKDRFNHYRPANQLNQMSVDKTFFSSKTLDNFEKVFKEINKLF